MPHITQSVKGVVAFWVTSSVVRTELRNFLLAATTAMRSPLPDKPTKKKLENSGKIDRSKKQACSCAAREASNAQKKASCTCKFLTWHQQAAAWRGVQPSLSCTFGLRERDSKNLVRSAYPWAAATCSWNRKRSKKIIKPINRDRKKGQRSSQWQLKLRYGKFSQDNGCYPAS